MTFHVKHQEVYVSAKLQELLRMAGGEVPEDSRVVAITVRVPYAVADAAGRAALRMDTTRAGLARDWMVLGMEQFQSALGPARWVQLVGQGPQTQSEAEEWDALAFEASEREREEDLEAWHFRQNEEGDA